MAEYLSAKEELEAMINGTHVSPDIEADEEQNESVDEGVESEEFGEQTEEDTTETEESTEEEAEDNEDTDQETEAEEEEDTEDTTDEENPETSETTEEGEEEDAHETTEDESTDESDEPITEENVDEIDYKGFYEKVALAKFTANGREVEGFKDPEDLVRAQQMLHGYSDKMKVFKEYKKFLKPLEERGVIADPDKFNLAMSLLDGDPEALKKVIKDKGMDPMEMDLEDIKYTPKNSIATEAQLVIDEAYTQATDLGVADKFNKVLTKDWDVDSLQEMVNNTAVRNDLLAHLKDGTYDMVQAEIRRMELLDSRGELDSVSSVDKYRKAIARLQQNQPKAVTAPVQPKVDNTAKIEAEKAKIEKDRQAAEFKKKAAEKEKAVAEQRKKAASVSKKKTVKKVTVKPNPEELSGDAFREHFKNMMMG